MIFRVRLKNGGEAYIFIVLEHKSMVDKLVAFQLLRYSVSIWEGTSGKKANSFPIIFPIVFYHGKSEWSVSESFSALFKLNKELEAFRPYLPEFRYCLFDLTKFKDEELNGNAALRVVLRVMKHIFGKDWREQGRAALRMLLRNADTIKKPLDIASLVLRYLAGAKQADIKELNNEFMEIMEEEKMETIIDIWEREATQKGLQQGLQQGESKVVLLLLKRKFGNLSSTIEDQICNLPLTKLEELSASLLDFEKVNDVTKWLKKNKQ